jgi:3-hydroxyisobutyrate dehydrogenase
VVIVDHTTTSASGTAARAKRWSDRGIAFLHAPVFMGPQNALEGTGLMLASGDRARFAALSPDLSKMTGKLIDVGPQPERAAAFKLLGNLFLMHLTTGVAEMFALSKALGVTASDSATIFEWFNPGMTLGARVKRMLEADFSHPSWELAMARKDARLMLDASHAARVPLEALEAIAAKMDRWIASGHAHDDWTVIAKDGL